MGLNGFLFGFVSIALMLFVTVVGGFVLVLTWGMSWRRPAALSGPDKVDFLGFATAVIVNPIGLFLLSLVSDAHNRAIFADLIIVSSIAISIGSLLLTLTSLKGRADLSSKILRNGARLLLICTAIALVGITAGIPGELETWRS